MEKCAVKHVDRNKVARARKGLPDARALAEIARVFGGLADPNRAKIIAILSRGEFCVCEITELLGMNQSAVSHMLRVLRDLRLVKSRKAGKMVHYSLDDRHIIDLFKIGLRHAGEIK